MILLQGVFLERIEAFWCEIWFLRLSFDHWNSGGDGSKNVKTEFWSQERWKGQVLSFTQLVCFIQNIGRLDGAERSDG